jgi:hypothetical protein
MYLMLFCFVRDKLKYVIDNMAFDIDSNKLIKIKLYISIF